MTIHGITHDAFIRDWEGTTDGGKTWKLAWQLDHRR
jgi:hypothetical protein